MGVRALLEPAPTSETRSGPVHRPLQETLLLTTYSIKNPFLTTSTQPLEPALFHTQVPVTTDPAPAGSPSAVRPSSLASTQATVHTHRSAIMSVVATGKRSAWHRSHPVTISSRKPGLTPHNVLLMIVALPQLPLAVMR